MAVEVPEVPEGAPKLKAMSREQHLDSTRLPRRDAQCALLFRPAGKRQAVSLVPLPFWPKRNRQEPTEDGVGGG